LFGRKGFLAEPFLFILGVVGPASAGSGKGERMQGPGLANYLRKIAGTIAQVNREKAVEFVEFELKELENIFSLLILGGFVGLPSPPAPIAMELFPLMERELKIMLSRSDFAQDPLASLMGILQVD